MNLLNRIKNFLVSMWQGIKVLPSLRPRHIPAILENLNKKDYLLLATYAVFILASSTFLVTKNMTQGSSGVADFGGEHIEGLVGQPRFINPVLAASSSVDMDLSRIIYAQLLKFDKDLQLVPDLLESMPEGSDDQKSYRLKLKSNLKWQDGKPLTSDDIIFTIQTIQNAEYESPLRTNWSRVRIEKVDDLTVDIHLREISSSFILNFTLGILPQHIWKDLSPNRFRLSDHNLQPIGSGPFVVREIKKTSDGVIKSLVLKSNDLYHEGRPYLDRVNFKFYDTYESLVSAYQAREILSLGYIPFDRRAFLEASDRDNQLQVNLPQYQAAFFNLKNPILSDKAVRQALLLTTNRQNIVEQVYQGFAKEAYGPILPGNLGYNDELKQTSHVSFEEANQILIKAGWVVDPATNQRVKITKRGNEEIKTPLEFDLVTNVFPLNVKTAQNLEEQWSRLGIGVNLTVVSQQDLESQYIRTRNFDVLLFSENTGADPDPFPFWHSSQIRDPGLNLSSFSHAEADRLLATARSTTDVGVRAQNYMQFQRIINDEVPAVFLNSAVYVYSVPKRLNAVELNTIIHPSERFLNIRNWYIETK